MNDVSVQFDNLLSTAISKRLLAENPTYAAYVGIQSARGKLGPRHARP